MKTFYMARGTIALFCICVIGVTIGIVFGIIDLLQSLHADPVGTALAMLLLILFMGGMLVAFPAYYLARRTRNIPLLTIDSRGAVLGGDWNQDLAVEWLNVREIRLREAKANGVHDVWVIFDLENENPLQVRARNRRQRATLRMNRLMFGEPFALSTAHLSGGPQAVIEAIGRHYRGPVVPD